MKTVTAIINTKGFCAVSEAQKPLVQDDFGRATSKEIRQYWKDLGDKGSETRRNFVWLAFVCLSQDSALNVLKMTVLADERDEVAELQQGEWNHLEGATNALAKEKREFEAERKQLRDQVEAQAKLNSALNLQLSLERDAKEQLLDQRASLGNELAKHQQVIAGLRTLKELLA